MELFTAALRKPVVNELICGAVFFLLCSSFARGFSSKKARLHAQYQYITKYTATPPVVWIASAHDMCGSCYIQQKKYVLVCQLYVFPLYFTAFCRHSTRSGAYFEDAVMSTGVCISISWTFNPTSVLFSYFSLAHFVNTIHAPKKYDVQLPNLGRTPALPLTARKYQATRKECMQIRTKCSNSVLKDTKSLFVFLLILIYVMTYLYKTVSTPTSFTFTFNNTFIYHVV